MKGIDQWIVVASLCVIGCGVCVAGPSIANVRAAQREGSNLVDIHYDMSGGHAAQTVWVLVSTNAGASYDLPASSVSGDVGEGVVPVTGLCITWDAGADWNGRYSPTVRIKVMTRDSPPPGFVLIPAGNFQMGDCIPDRHYADERPVHTVYVSAFHMMATETTKAEWDDVRLWASTNGYADLPEGGGKAPDHPVQTVTWYAVVRWCNARSEKEGLTPCYYTTAAKTTVYRTGNVNVASDAVAWGANGYRLPTEAEWEKAARGGTAGHRFPWSDADTITHSRANYYADPNHNLAYDVSPTLTWHPTFAVGVMPYTSPAGYFTANGYGLFDMAGNVWEGCWDWYGGYPSSPTSDPTGPSSGTYRTHRGGYWYESGAVPIRVAYRGVDLPSFGHQSSGFRPVRTAAGPVSGESQTVTGDTRGDGLPPASEDCDGDGRSNGDECRAGTDPRDPRSRFKADEWSAVPNTDDTGVIYIVQWASVAGRVYGVERSFDMKQWDLVVDNISSTPPTNTISDEVVPKPKKAFYRIVVK